MGRGPQGLRVLRRPGLPANQGGQEVRGAAQLWRGPSPVQGRGRPEGPLKSSPGALAPVPCIHPSPIWPCRGGQGSAQAVPAPSACRLGGPSSPSGASLRRKRQRMGGTLSPLQAPSCPGGVPLTQEFERRAGECRSPPPTPAPEGRAGLPPTCSPRRACLEGGLGDKPRAREVPG